jgi:hypothetical protein
MEAARLFAGVGLDGTTHPARLRMGELRMKHVYRVLVMAFILSIPCWYVPVIIHDLTHPELWSDWRHNPQVYGVMALGVGAVCLGLAWRAMRLHVRLKELESRAKAPLSVGDKPGSGPEVVDRADGE